MTPCLPSQPRLTFESANGTPSVTDIVINSTIFLSGGIAALGAALVGLEGNILAVVPGLFAMALAWMLAKSLGRWVLLWWLHRALPLEEMEAQVFFLTRRVMLQANAPILTHIPVIVSWRVDTGGVHLNSLRLGGMPSLRNAKRHIAALPTLPLRTPWWYPVLSWACRRFHVRPKAHALLRAVTAHERMALLSALADHPAIKPAPSKPATTQPTTAP